MFWYMCVRNRYREVNKIEGEIIQFIFNVATKKKGRKENNKF